MSEEAAAPVAEVATPVALNDAPAQFSSVSEAARFLSQARRKEEPSAESAKPATAELESAPEAAADPETDPGTIEPEAPEPEVELPPIERPRSWAKELDEEWASYPREAQEKIAKREQDRDAAIRRSQNEAAEVRKAAEAAQKQAEEVRKEFEAKLPALSKTLESAIQKEFSDIQSFEDVRKMQAEDPFRYQQWDLHQKELAMVKQEEQAALQRQSTDRQTKRAQYEAEQHKLLVELVPEMAEPKKAGELRERAVAMLTDDLGLKTEQLSRWMQDDTGHEILSNAGIQKLIADGLKYRDIQSAPKAVAAKPLPPVQRPGVAQPKGASGAQKVQDIQKQLKSASGMEAIRLGAKLLQAQRGRR